MLLDQHLQDMAAALVQRAGVVGSSHEVHFTGRAAAPALVCDECQCRLEWPAAVCPAAAAR
jgi:hypothetical protein